MIVAIAMLAPAAAAAQDLRPSVEFTGGILNFADDGIVMEGMIGAAARFPVTRRISVGPEMLFVSGTNHSHLIATGNVTYDIFATDRTAMPFLVAGGGFFRTREQFPAGAFSSTEGAFTAGGGLRAAIGRRAYAGIDARVGWEPHVRVNALLGWSF